MCDSCNCNCLGCSKTSQTKWKYTLYTTLIALVIFSPFTYSLMQNLLGWMVTISKKGCPTMVGLLLHLLVFTLLLRYSMELNI